MTAREVVKILKADGWTEARQVGSHKHFTHPTKPGLVTVQMHGSKDIPAGTLANIFRQAGIRRQP